MECDGRKDCLLESHSIPPKNSQVPIEMILEILVSPLMNSDKRKKINPDIYKVVSELLFVCCYFFFHFKYRTKFKQFFFFLTFE